MRMADSGHTCCGGISRRELFATAAGIGAAATPARAWKELAAGDRRPPVRQPLRVQPVLVCRLYERKPQQSWRPWGGLMNEQDVAEEKERIGRELASMKTAADCSLELLPLETVRTPDQAGALANSEADTILMYGAGAGVEVYEALNSTRKWNLLFVRHRTGPAYLWYEIAHPRFLRKTVDEYGEPGMDSRDVVVDSYEDVLWRLRALAALKNTLGKRIVCVGGPGGWGKGGQKAPDLARQRWRFDLVTVPYEEVEARIRAARADNGLVSRTRAAADRYLNERGVRLETDPEAVRRSFLLTDVFHTFMDEAETDAFTINHCMRAIMPLSETTACLPLSLMNDGGYLAFCESDFVVIPAGVLLHYISGKPVFLNDPTYPHHGLVTLAHCTAPRRMNGKNDEPVRILTHFESDYGAAPKVEMRKGQVITNIVPDFACKRWVGFEGEIVANPFMAICRSQIDVKINGDCDLLAREMQGFHWMTSYGNYLNEIGYALNKVGVDWLVA